jgi:perosamine synthetase
VDFQKYSLMSRYLSPTGSPIQTGELLSWLGSVLSSTDYSESIKRMVARDLQLSFGTLYITGRAAMASVLESIMRLRGHDDQRNEIIIPAYTCYSVASSAINAGFNIRLCDIDPVTLSYDLDCLHRLDTDRVLAMVSANLYGLPNDLPALERFANEHGIHLIDDAAQALYARIDGRGVGSYGRAGILSFDKGKNVTSLQGGMVVTEDESLNRYLTEQQGKLSDLDLKGKLKEFFKVLVYYTFLHPVMYQIPANISFSGLGETIYEDEVTVLRYPPMLSSLVKDQLSRGLDIAANRTAVGQYYDRSFDGVRGVTRIIPLSGAEPVYLRYPILVDDKQTRLRLLDEKRALGISASYPKALSQLPEIRHKLVGQSDCPGAEWVAQQIITLPTHAYVRQQDMSEIVDSISNLSLRGEVT